MRTILSRALAELNAHQSVVLVTIVAEQGSAPRGPGSQMLVGADGQLTGTLGGGQVERQSELLALSLLKERRSQIQHFALTQAGADSLGMACGGDVTVLFQFISPEDTLWQSVLETALDRLTAAQPGWLILRTDGSAPALLDGEGMALLGSSGTAHLSKRCVLTETDFSLPLPIGERAVIFGAGHIARALVPLLRSVEFRPVVYDDRPALADPAAFPDAEKNDVRTVMHFHPALAPVKIGVLPLSKKLNEGAEKVFAELSKKYNCEFDDRGNIGKRYRRQDEIGTPYCITYDFDSETDGAVTVRDRDTMEQERIKIEDLDAYFADKFTF